MSINTVELDEQIAWLYQMKSQSDVWTAIELDTIAAAECGDAADLWAFVKDWSPSLFEGTSKWQLIYDPLYQHYFANLPAHQKLLREYQGPE